MRWLTPFCSIPTLHSLSLPLIFCLPLFRFPALRSVDYEDTSSFLTVWPLLHVLMRSAYLHSIINKSKKWLFLSLSLTCSFISPFTVPAISRSRWKTGNGVPVDFLCTFSLSPLPLHVQDHHPPIPFYIISKERNYFCSTMILSSSDIICFNFNLNVMDVMGFLN